MFSDTSFSTPSVEATSSTTPSWPSLDASSDPFDDTVSTTNEKRTQRTLAPNLTRRSHKKSRAGCFSCKTRKIKCQETRPTCENCDVKGLTCQYPTNRNGRDNGPLTIARRPQPSSLSPTTDTFTMTDMRFFHHFLTMAYPHLPLGNEAVWVNEIPKFAQEHDYLMHAMLALGASHLDRISPNAVGDYHTKAIVHRGHAMAGLSRALAKSERPYGESDAMVATCYSLTFQSTYLSDGLFDFITMVRGCALVTGKIREEGSPTAFNLQPDWQFKLMEPRLNTLPVVHQPLLDSGIVALEEVRPLLVTRTDHQFHSALVKVIHGLSRSSRDGYTSFISVYALWYELCNDSFKGEQIDSLFTVIGSSPSPDSDAWEAANTLDHPSRRRHLQQLLLDLVSPLPRAIADNSRIHESPKYGRPAPTLVFYRHPVHHGAIVATRVASPI
jgi:Fungal Zn(2)-Cys(6) binuclear cluster domain/Fungal specific transcription factor domain